MTKYLVGVEIELDDEQTNELVLEDLMSMRNVMKEYQLNRHEDKGIPVFDMDKETDILKIRKLVEAFDQVIAYYDAPVRD